MTGLKLRDYQQEDLDAIEEAWAGGTRRPAVVWATGLGKTVLFSKAAERFRRRTGRRVLVLVHRTELSDQAANKLRSVAPDLRVGVVMGQRNQTLTDVVVASPQTLRSETRRRQLLDVGLVIVDEVHHYAAPSFRTVIDYFMEQDERNLLLGVTATLQRGDRRSLAKVVDKVVSRRTISFGIANGHLVRPEGKRVTVEDFHPEDVKRTAGDYDPAELGKALVDSLAPKKIAEAIAEHAPEDKAVIFLPDIQSADVVAEACTEAGFRTDSVNYKTPAARRREILAEHADERPGSLQVVTNAMVLTEGWDNPLCSTAVIGRKTTHQGLYIQMVGRVLRPYPGKSRALVLDVAGASEQHTLDAGIDLSGEQGEGPERDPCLCQPAVLVQLGAEDCTCRRNGCTDACLCGGGRLCGCEWPEQLEVIPERVEKIYREGKLRVEDVDLFHGSKIQWGMTYGGTHFLPAGFDHYIAIVPGEAPATWDVVRMHKYRQGESRWIQRAVTDIGFAQAWAEADILPGENAAARRDRGWKADPPSDAQLGLAARYGLRVAEGMHRGEVSTLIDTHVASMRMDAIVQRLRLAQQGRTVAYA